MRTLDALQREPFRILFPLGILLSWAGVGHWLLLGLGGIESYHSIFHAMTQVQGFMTCFVTGFLFTMIPRRTQTAPPSLGELAVVIAAPVLVVALAWQERWAAATFVWMAQILLVVAFAIRRFRFGANAIPNSFVWIPIALVLGLGGAVLTAVGAANPSTMWLHDLGRALLLQGMLTAMILGVGGMLFPALTRDAGLLAVSPSVGAKIAHLCAALVFAASFWIQVRIDARAGAALRAVVIASVLVGSAGLWRLPNVRELHRHLIWIAAWLLVAGPALEALFPGYRRAALHVTFIGGFALMVFAVSVHVFRAHSGRVGPVPPLRLRALTLLVAAALVARGLMDLDPPRFSLWISAASASFLLATLVWGSLVLRGPATAGRAMSTGTPLGLVILAVSDVARATDFYRVAFGWDPVVEASVYTEFRLPGGMRLGLYEREGFGKNVGEVPSMIPRGKLAPTELYFFPADLDSAIARLTTAGARLLSPLAGRDWGDEAAYFSDPDGNVLVVARSIEQTK